MKNTSVVEFPSFLGFTNKKPNRYAVILAGGDGTRLKTLTRAITGDERPKQFCPILGSETLLDKTVSRAEISIRKENILYSLTKKHEHFYQPVLNNVARHQLVVQPENKGTAPAILYALLRLVKMDPEAVVAFLPSDHYFSDDKAFMSHVERAFRAAERQPESLILLGIEPEKPETSYGWIEPTKSILGGMSSAISKVARFWEKPTFEKAEDLMKGACLWNSFVMVGTVSTFLAVIKKHLPDLYKIFEASSVTFGTSAEAQTIRSLYAWIADSNFSSDVLEKCVEELFVLRVADVVWSDWGEPQRVLGTLSQLGVQTEWMTVAV